MSPTAPVVPELPEIAAYLHALRPRIVGATLEAVRVRSVALLRTWDPPLEAAAGRGVVDVRRLGKRIVVALESTGSYGLDLALALHRVKRIEVSSSSPNTSPLFRSLLMECGSILQAVEKLTKNSNVRMVLNTGTLNGKQT